MEDKIFDSLGEARESLLDGLRLANQGSYARRAPSASSLPHFAHARGVLLRILAESPGHQEALLMMSRVSESLLEFEAALSYLSRAFAAGEPKTKKALKRLALLRENSIAWRDLGLSPEKLQKLGDYLEAQSVNPSHTTLRLTRNWLSENNIENPKAVVEALERRGAFSDFQVLANVVHG
jgi:hypothetical protein